MAELILFLFLSTISFVLYKWYRKSVLAKRERLIHSFTFPKTIQRKILDKYPHLGNKQTNLIMEGLREYFCICNIAGKKMVSMPSQSVDVAWHEFILFTKQYELFCSKALGRFLHHTPAEAMRAPTIAQKGIKIAWKISCGRENIAPKSPYKLPILFALDSQLNIPDGFKYSLNCESDKNSDYCAGHIGCSSGCVGGSYGESDGDSGGCGGGGCGGD